ncbi:MAG: hypothetical protein ACRC92_20330 [Peptostreptococcaceae bacterium]
MEKILLDGKTTYGIINVDHRRGYFDEGGDFIFTKRSDYTVASKHYEWLFNVMEIDDNKRDKISWCFSKNTFGITEPEMTAGFYADLDVIHNYSVYLVDLSKTEVFGSTPYDEWVEFLEERVCRPKATECEDRLVDSIYDADMNLYCSVVQTLFVLNKNAIIKELNKEEFDEIIKNSSL